MLICLLVLGNSCLLQLEVLMRVERKLKVVSLQIQDTELRDESLDLGVEPRHNLCFLEEKMSNFTVEINIYRLKQTIVQAFTASFVL